MSARSGLLLISTIVILIVLNSMLFFQGMLSSSPGEVHDAMRQTLVLHRFHTRVFLMHTLTTLGHHFEASNSKLCAPPDYEISRPRQPNPCRTNVWRAIPSLMWHQNRQSVQAVVWLAPRGLNINRDLLPQAIAGCTDIVKLLLLTSSILRRFSSTRSQVRLVVDQK